MERILIIDDDKLIRWSLNELLSQQGYEVDVAGTTQEALTKAGNTSYDLVFADCEINDEDGFQMLKEIKSCQPGVKIIILSALPAQQIQSRLGDFSIYSIIEKPFRSDQIISLSRKVLSRKNNSSSRKNDIDPKHLKEV